jgi:hypothetical protein
MAFHELSDVRGVLHHVAIGILERANDAIHLAAQPGELAATWCSPTVSPFTSSSHLARALMPPAVMTTGPGSADGNYGGVAESIFGFVPRAFLLPYIA